MKSFKSVGFAEDSKQAKQAIKAGGDEDDRTEPTKDHQSEDDLDKENILESMPKQVK